DVHTSATHGYVPFPAFYPTRPEKGLRSTEMSWAERYASDPELGDFIALPRGRDRVLVRRGYEDRIAEVGWWGDERREVGRSSGGRAAHPVVQLSSGEKLLVRRFQRGGAVRHINRETY